MSARLQAFLDTNRITQAAVARALTERGIRMDPFKMNRTIKGHRTFSVDEAAGILDYLSEVVGKRVTFEETFGAEPQQDAVDPSQTEAVIA